MRKLKVLNDLNSSDTFNKGGSAQPYVVDTYLLDLDHTKSQ